jgi:hypothetical protein
MQVARSVTSGYAGTAQEGQQDVGEVLADTDASLEDFG